ncbi:MAG: hypothetical protein ABW185_12130 [Sedimenticola sp.]
MGEKVDLGRCSTETASVELNSVVAEAGSDSMDCSAWNLLEDGSLVAFEGGPAPFLRFSCLALIAPRSLASSSALLAVAGCELDVRKEIELSLEDVVLRVFDSEDDEVVVGGETSTVCVSVETGRDSMDGVPWPLGHEYSV